VFCSGSVGVIIKNEFNKKLAYYGEICAFLHLLKAKIAFSRDTIAECIDQFIALQQSKNKAFWAALKNYYNSGENNQDKIFDELKISLSSQEKQELWNIFSSLGKLDIDGEQETIQNALINLDIKIKAMEAAKKNKWDFIDKLAICVGILICILIY
jgi:stage III sporulation protein AB